MELMHFREPKALSNRARILSAYARLSVFAHIHE